MAREHRGPGCTGVRGLGHGPRLHQRRRRVVVAAAEKGETGSERVIDPPGPVAGHGRSPWPLCALKEWQSGRCRCRQKQQTTNNSQTEFPLPGWQASSASHCFDVGARVVLRAFTLTAHSR